MPQVTHVVLVEWSGASRAAEAEALVDAHLPHVPGVLRIDRGGSISGEGLEGGFDWLLVVRFADEPALAAYLPHPEHRPVAAFLGAHAARIVVFDTAASGDA